jgi:SpoIID/LytB domain protein
VPTPRSRPRRRATSVVTVLTLLTLVPLASAGTPGEGWPVREDVAATSDPSSDLRVEGSGWGHSVGMSQYGARAQARAGRAVDTILGHYYPGTSLASRPTGDPSRAEGAPIRVGLASGRSEVTLRSVDAAVTWYRCADGAAACEPLDDVAQAAGQSLQVRATSGRTLEVRRGSTTVATVDVDGAYLAADHDGRLVEGPNPVTGTATYRHGRTEFAVRGGDVVVSQRVPDVERYLRGLAEMPSSWPDAALQAQAIVGRTFALRALTGTPRDACRCHLVASPADQAYTGWNKEGEAGGAGERWTAAVRASAGRVVTYQGSLAATYYSSSHGGSSENIEDSWAYGSAAVPYLRAVDDPWSVAPDAGNPRASWDATLPAERLRRLVSEDLHVLHGVEVLDRTDGGTPRTLRFRGSDRSGAEVRIDWPSSGKPAGARLRAAYGASLLPSQQLTSVETASNVPLTDLGGSGHVDAIRFAYEAGITRGLTDTRFEPRRAVTREQMASFIDRTFELPPGDGGRFDDVPAGSQHAAAIGALAGAGITEGCRERSFCPRDPVTREQMASFLVRAAGFPPAGTPPFLDVGAGSTHGGAVAALAASGVTEGCRDDHFCPRDPVTRAQMTTFLYRTVRSR